VSDEKRETKADNAIDSAIDYWIDRAVLNERETNAALAREAWCKTRIADLEKRLIAKGELP
jgi:hypothetical protein